MTRDGFSILAMGFTGKAAMEWKEKFIAAFNAMESALRDQSDKAAKSRTSKRQMIADKNELRINSLHNQRNHWLAIRNEADNRIAQIERDLTSYGADESIADGYTEVCTAGPWEAGMSLTTSQRCEIRAEISARLHSFNHYARREDYRTIYAALNASMRVATYHDIPQARFYEALRFIKEFDPLPARATALQVKRGN